MTDSEPTTEAARARFRRTLIQVLMVQAVALLFLGLLQFTYSG